MTPPHRRTDSDRMVARTPTPPTPAQQRSAEQKATARIDADEFWRRLGL